MTTTPLLTRQEIKQLPTFRERFAALQALEQDRRAEKLHTKHFRKARRKQGPNPELFTTVTQWEQAQLLMSKGWELVDTQRNTWKGGDMPGMSAVLKYTI